MENFKNWVIKKIGKENYINHFPSHYSEIEMVTMVDEYHNEKISEITEIKNILIDGLKSDMDNEIKLVDKVQTLIQYNKSLESEVKKEKHQKELAQKFWCLEVDKVNFLRDRNKIMSEFILSLSELEVPESKKVEFEELSKKIKTILSI